MGSFRYEIDISDYQTRMAMRYLLLENFEIGELKYRHMSDGEATTFPIKLKPDICETNLTTARTLISKRLRAILSLLFLFNTNYLFIKKRAIALLNATAL